MTKTALPLVLAALLAAGPALAQNGEAGRAAPDRPQGPSLVDRAKSAGRSVADKTRNLMHRGEQKVDNARNRNDDSTRGTGAMGNRGRDEPASRTRKGDSSSAAGSSSSADAGTRQQRMDSAYGDWQRRNGGTQR